MATYTMAWDVGAVIGGVLLGIIVDATSYSFGFLLMGFLPLGGIVVYAFGVAGRDSKQAHPANGDSPQ